MDQPKPNPLSEEISTEATDPADDFSTTQWSVVMEAGLTDERSSAQALEKLCSRYWSPVYTLVLRRLKNAHEAEDVTQAFFANLINRETLKKADQRKGRFRTFLLAALTDFLAQRKNYPAQPAGHQQVISLNEVSRRELDQQAAGSASPEKMFDQGWALAVLEAALNRLKEEYSVDKKVELYERLKPGLTGRADQGWYAILAAEMQMSEGAIRVALHRLRRRFGELLRKEVGRTVARPEDIDEELRHLFSVIEAAD